MVGCELSCENGSQGETLARMGTVLDGNHISIAVIHHGVDSRNLAIAYAVDDQVFISNVCIALIVMTILCPISNATLPVLLSVDVVDDFLGKGDGCSRWRIELMNVVGFLHAYRVLWETIHDFSQIAVYGRENGHTDAEVRGPEEGLLTVGAEFLHVFLMVFHPTCRT